MSSVNELEFTITCVLHRRVISKFSDLAYNRREIWDKRPLARDPDRSWCHLHTSVKLFWLLPMAPWTVTKKFYTSVAVI